MILGQDVYHAIRPLEYFAADEKRSPFAVRLPIGWVLSGPLPSSSGLISKCFKANMEQDFELASQVKSWYDMESYGALKQVDPRSVSDARAHDILENTTVHNGEKVRYWNAVRYRNCGTPVYTPRLWGNKFAHLRQLRASTHGK